MAGKNLNQLVDQLRHIVGGPTVADEPEGTLLDRFISERDESAFAELLQRHGPMVLRVCQRLLANPADADDAFQATFVVLVRRAGAIRRQASLASWLYGVACRCAGNIRTRSARRRTQESQVTMTETDANGATERAEINRLLGEELHRLPEKYRAPLVLCYLEGKTGEEAARQLGWTPGTLWGRLARAREMLHGRLTRRGLALSAPALALALSPTAAPAAVPISLLRSTIQAAGAAGPLSGPVTATVTGVLHDMFFTKLKIAAGIVLGLGLAGTVAGLGASQMRDGNHRPAVLAAAPLPPAPADDREVSMPVDKFKHKLMGMKDFNDVNATTHGAVVLNDAPEDATALYKAFEAALAEGKKGKVAVKGKALSIVTSAGAPFGSGVQICKLVRQGNRLRMEVTCLLYQSLDKNYPALRMLEGPIELPPGSYNLEVTWKIAAGDIAETAKDLAKEKFSFDFEVTDPQAPVGEREIILPVDKFKNTLMPMKDFNDVAATTHGAVVLNDAPEDANALYKAFEAALAEGKKGKVAVKGKALTIVTSTAAPYGSSVQAGKLVRQGNRLRLDVACVLFQKLEKNYPALRMLQGPIDLPAGSYNLEVNWVISMDISMKKNEPAREKFSFDFEVTDAK